MKPTERRRRHQKIARYEQVHSLVFDVTLESRIINLFRKTKASNRKGLHAVIAKDFNLPGWVVYELIRKSLKKTGKK